VPDIRARWRTSFTEATSYDRAVEHAHVAGAPGRVIWGTDISGCWPGLRERGGYSGAALLARAGSPLVSASLTRNR